MTIFSVSWDNHLDHLRQVLSRVKLAQLTLNLKIYVLAHAEIDFLGHPVGLNEGGCVTLSNTSK